jgi:hypothetical protein
MWQSKEEIANFVADFESGVLPKHNWTHEAHFVMGFWYCQKFSAAEALARARVGIRAYNEAVGTVNSDTGGYHETLTCFYIFCISHFLANESTQSGFVEQLGELLDSRWAARQTPLLHYSRERLFSVQARRAWLAPDLLPLGFRVE